MDRRACCDKREVKKGHWSPEEDKILSHFIHKYGPRNWRELSKKSGLLRCGKSCRLRWINYLRPDIKRGGFTSQEEAAIIQLHKLLGNRWSRIAACFPGRTDNEIKNVWNTKLKKRVGNDQSVISVDVCMQDSTSIKEVSHAENLSFLPFPSQQNDSADFPTSLFYDTDNMSTEIFQSDCIHSSIDCSEQHSSSVPDDLAIDKTFVLEDEETWLQPRQNQNMNTYNEVLCEGGSSIETQYLMDAYLEDDLLSCMDSADTYHKGSDDGSDCTDDWFNTLCQIQPPPVL